MADAAPTPTPAVEAPAAEAAAQAPAAPAPAGEMTVDGAFTTIHRFTAEWWASRASRRLFYWGFYYPVDDPVEFDPTTDTAAFDLFDRGKTLREHRVQCWMCEVQRGTGVPSTGFPKPTTSAEDLAAYSSAVALLESQDFKQMEGPKHVSGGRLQYKSGAGPNALVNHARSHHPKLWDIVKDDNFPSAEEFRKHKHHTAAGAAAGSTPAKPEAAQAEDTTTPRALRYVSQKSSGRSQPSQEAPPMDPIMIKNFTTIHNNTAAWWADRASRKLGYWGFYYPLDDQENSEPGTGCSVFNQINSGLSVKAHRVQCWVCQVMRGLPLPSSGFPVPPEGSENYEAFQEAVAAIAAYDFEELRVPKNNSGGKLQYKSAYGPNALINHCKSHHQELYNLLKDYIPPPREPGTTRKRPRNSMQAGGNPDHPTPGKAVKKLKTDSQRQEGFLHLLSCMMVGSQIPVSVMDSPWFRAFILLLDPSVTLPSKEELTAKHLPAAVEQTKADLAASLESVRGLSLTLSPLQTGGSSSVLSLDASFISSGWEPATFHLGLVKEDGGDTAAQVQALLEQHGMSSKVFSCASDQMAALPGPVSCTATGRSAPYMSADYVLAVTEACNSGIAMAKGQTFATKECDVSGALECFQKVASLLEQSQPAMAAYEKACAALGAPANKTTGTPAEGHFTEVHQQLSALLPQKEVFRKLFADELTEHSGQAPTDSDFQVAAKLNETLDLPSTSVAKLKAESPCLISDVVNLAARLCIEFRTKVASLAQDEAKGRRSKEQKFEEDLLALETTARQAVLDSLTPLLQPLIGPTPDVARAHVVLSLLVDPRFCDGSLIYLLAPAQLSREQKQEHHKVLMSAYDKEHLVPAMVAMGSLLRAQTVTPVKELPAPTDMEDEVPDLLGSFVSSEEAVAGAEKAGQGSDLERKCTEELQRFRATFRSQADSMKSCKPLTWWKTNAEKFPVLAEVARVVLTASGPQLLGEGAPFGVPKLAADLSHVGPESLGAAVAIMKNLPQLKTITKLLSERHGAATAKTLAREATTVAPVVVEPQVVDGPPKVEIEPQHQAQGSIGALLAED